MRHNIFDSIPSDIVSDKANVFADFLQTAGLYDSMKISEDNIQDLILLLDGKVRISAYCKECKEKRVFSMKPIYILKMMILDVIHRNFRKRFSDFRSRIFLKIHRHLMKV